MMLLFIASLLRAFLFAYGGMTAAVVVHGRLLKAVMKAKIAFFDNTPHGRILNRLVELISKSVLWNRLRNTRFLIRNWASIFTKIIKQRN
jgi:ABC-type bacteriocin/lantibiotic exporter with double-glycine peptidase domain